MNHHKPSNKNTPKTARNVRPQAVSLPAGSQVSCLWGGPPLRRTWAERDLREAPVIKNG